jgi:hypothetical protein
MALLPDADEIFRTFFAPWYSPQDFARRGFAATRPDAQGWARAGVAALDASQLTIEGQQEVQARVSEMFKAAADDWPRSVHVLGPPSIEWIDAFDRYFDRYATSIATLLRSLRYFDRYDDRARPRRRSVDSRSTVS